MQITTIGLDLAKNVFQVHGVDAAGKAFIRKKLRRAECPGSSRISRPAWSGWRPVRPRTTRPGRSQPWAMTSA
jgi:hypothetical protein